MHKSFILFLLIFSYNISFSQGTGTTINLGTTDISNIAIIADSNQNMCLYYQTPKTDNFKIVNTEGKVSKTFSLKNKDYDYGDKLALHGIVTTDSAYLFYFESLKGKLFINTYYISKTGSDDKKITDIDLKLNKGDKLIDAFSNRKNLYVITYNKKLKKINILEFISASKYKVHTFDSSKQLEEFLAESNFTVIKNNTNLTIETVARNKKLYVTEADKFILTWDNHEFDTDEPDVDDHPESDTKFWVFDLKTDKLEKRVFPKTSYHNNNTFYYHNKLYKFSLSNDHMRLELFDAASAKSLYKYEYSKKDSIAIINGHVTQTGKNTAFMANEGDRELKEPQKILKRLNKGVPAVAVQNELGDTLSLLIGSHQKIDQSSYTVTNPGTAGAMGAPAVMLINPATPGYFVPGNTGESSYNTWFSTAIKQSDYSIVGGFAEIPAFKKSSLFINSLKDSGVKIEKNVLFKINKTNYLGYLSRKSTMFTIIAIP